MSAQIAPDQIDGWDRIEQPLGLAALTCVATFTKDGVGREIHVDRVLVDRWGQDWRYREERRLLQGGTPTRYFGQSAAPEADPQ